jgi:cytochrome c551
MQWRHGSPMTLVFLRRVSLVLGLTGCGRQTTVLQQDQATYPIAIQVYESGCITCHGNNLQGGIGPSLQHVGSRMTLSQIDHQIEVGGGAMPAYALPRDAILTPNQIHQVAKWLSTKT